MASLLEQVLEMLKQGKTPGEISVNLNVPEEEVLGMIKILESLGYVEEITLGSEVCETCPLKKICRSSCLRMGGKVITGFTLPRKD